MIKGVTFDWWHTIVETPWPDYDERMREIRVRRVGETLAGAGVRTDADTLYRAYDRHTELLRENWARRVDLTAGEQMQAFLGFAGLDGADDRLMAAVQDAFGTAILTKLPIPLPHIAETLARLKAEGYAVGIVSNTGRTWGRYLRTVQEKLGIAAYFDARVFSDEVRVRKPDPRIFQTALEALGLRPGEAVHIGDDVDADVAGAKGLGSRAVWFNTGFWPGAKTDQADAEIHDHAELPAILERWRR